jgi:hypothetical protein
MVRFHEIGHHTESDSNQYCSTHAEPDLMPLYTTKSKINEKVHLKKSESMQWARKEGQLPYSGTQYKVKFSIVREGFDMHVSLCQIWKPYVNANALI